jgi:hypothetical protein
MVVIGGAALSLSLSLPLRMRWTGSVAVPVGTQRAAKAKHAAGAAPDAAGDWIGWVRAVGSRVFPPWNWLAGPLVCLADGCGSWRLAQCQTWAGPNQP